MKKTMIIGLVLLAVLSFASSAMSATMTNEPSDAGKSIALNGNALVLNFSPGVFGQYNTTTTLNNEQWFSIGTYHGGGDWQYATSQQQTAVWKVKRIETTNTFATYPIPVTKALSDSDAQWTAAGFTK